MSSLEHSRALWNRDHLDLRSDEILAQIVDRGSLDDWRSLFALAATDGQLRHRLALIIGRVAVPLPHFWLAALKSLGEDVNVGQAVPEYDAPIA